MKYFLLLIVLLVTIYSKGQQTTTIITKVAPPRHLHVGCLEEYTFLRDSLETLFKERLFVPALVGAADSVISSTNLPVTVFIKSDSVTVDLKDLERGNLAFVGMIYDKLLRCYQQFKSVTVTTLLIKANKITQIPTVYYLQPGKVPDEEKRILVYCKQRKKWASLKIYTRESGK